MNKFETCVYCTLTIFDTWAVVEVDIHLYTILGLVIINHVANVLETKRLHFAITHLDKYWCLKFLCGTTNCNQCLLVVNIKCADSKALTAAALH
ncbi:hypothetical protein D9M68_930360 [compost metagenome]